MTDEEPLIMMSGLLRRGVSWATSMSNRPPSQLRRPSRATFLLVPLASGHGEHPSQYLLAHRPSLPQGKASGAEALPPLEFSGPFRVERMGFNLGRTIR